nr:MAG TPA: hypothetical protein [Caudoviricetes sp.]
MTVIRVTFSTIFYVIKQFLAASIKIGFFVGLLIAPVLALILAVLF